MSASSKITVVNQKSQSKAIDKIINDLEDLCKKLTDNFAFDALPLTNDSVDLQKFCFKFEYLLQYKLKIKKSILNTKKEDYWQMLVNLLNNNRCFDDAIKYVKSLNETKTNLGRGRAFIRFCLQYHRLADAIQQITMEDKTLMNWYGDDCVWLNGQKKAKLIQILYDINDIDFNILETKVNYELDTSWPTILNQKRVSNISNNISCNTSISSRQRTRSQSSVSSVNTDLLSSTPLEMDDDIFSKLSINFNMDKPSMTVEEEEKQVVRVEVDRVENETQTDYVEVESKSIYGEFWEKETQTEEAVDDWKVKYEELRQQNEQMEVSLKDLDELKGKNLYYEDLSEKLRSKENDNELLKQELQALKFDLSAKTLHEENLAKEAISQSELLATLKEMCLQQEITIKQLKKNLDLIKSERKQEMDLQNAEVKEMKTSVETKKEENYLLQDQVNRLTRVLDNEKKTNKSLMSELSEVKAELEIKVNVNNQLEMDNNEIKKRLVKLIKEKADLWQKADSLEYENLLKSNAMWQDDASVHNCLDCNSQFGLMLRKHHCRVCLKIYCYYCCNNWIEYNNSKIRVCKKCAENQELMIKQNHIETIKVNHDIPIENNQVDEDEDDDDDDPDINFEVRAEKLGDDSTSLNTSTLSTNSPNKVNLNNNMKKDKSSSFSFTTKHQQHKQQHQQQRQQHNCEDEYFYRPENSIDDSDTFAIVSNEEINRILFK